MYLQKNAFVQLTAPPCVMCTHIFSFTARHNHVNYANVYFSFIHNSRDQRVECTYSIYIQIRNVCAPPFGGGGAFYMRASSECILLRVVVVVVHGDESIRKVNIRLKRHDVCAQLRPHFCGKVVKTRARVCVCAMMSSVCRQYGFDGCSFEYAIRRVC